MHSKTLSASENYSLSNGTDGIVSTVVLGLVFTLSGSVTIKGRPWGSTATPAAIAYRTFAAPDTPVTTAITADALIQIDAAGIEVFADYTRTTGSLVLEYNLVLG